MNIRSVKVGRNFAVLNGIAREGFTEKVIFEQRLKIRTQPWDIWVNRISSRKSQNKGSEVRTTTRVQRGM
jgi:hypothetical protein